MTKPDPYRVLHLKPDAPDAVVRAVAEAQRQRCTDAEAALTDPAKRRAVDVELVRSAIQGRR